MFHEALVYGSVLGAGLLADIACPDSEGPFPVILSVHGGRWIRGTRHDNGAIDVLQWADLGFFAMTIDYRLVTCTPAPACYQDVMCAIRWVHAHATEYKLDTEKVFLMGQSAGGHMVSLAATAGDNLFPKTGGWETGSGDIAGVISVSGAYDLISLDWGSGWCPLGIDWHTARSHASPINHISSNNKPLLLFHSDDDRSVPIQQAINMVDALDAKGSTYEFIRYKDKGHLGISDDVIQKTLDFIWNQVGGSH
ncbi:MAG: acetyl esterase [Candidatus Latescibacterota bacterium]|jgi:acetyl esterase